MRFFQGIYGFDLLSLIILLLSSILSLWRYTYIIGLILLFIVVYRTLSRDIYRRKNEYRMFRTWFNRIFGKIGLSIPDNLPNLDSNNISQVFRKIRQDIEKRRKYKPVTCPGCHKKLMLPRGRGKVIITCRACKTEFKAKV